MGWRTRTVRRTAHGATELSTPRVVFVSSHGQLGGSEKVLEQLAAGLARDEVAEIVVLQDGPLVERLRQLGFPASCIPTGASKLAVVASSRRLARRLGILKPDVVHANGVKAAIVSVMAAKRTPVVWMKHDVSFDGRVVGFLARRCAAIVGVSDEVLQGIGQHAAARVVNPGVDVDAGEARRAGEKLRRSLDLTGPVVSVIGRMERTKGHAEALAALPGLIEEVPGVQLLLVGGDDDNHPGVRAELRAQAHRLGLADRVHLLGHTPSDGVTAASDVVVVPSVPDAQGRGREGFGLVAAEALVLGVPVVAYDVGATREVIGDCGILVPPNDRPALTRSLTQTLTDAELRHTLKRCGQERAASFTVHRMVEAMSAVYRDVTT